MILRWWEFWKVTDIYDSIVAFSTKKHPQSYHPSPIGYCFFMFFHLIGGRNSNMVKNVRGGSRSYKWQQLIVLPHFYSSFIGIWIQGQFFYKFLFMISHKAKLISRNEKEALLLVQSGSKYILVASVVSLLCTTFDKW